MSGASVNNRETDAARNHGAAGTSVRGAADERLTIREGESFNGAVARWCAASHLERMIEVTRSAGALYGHRATLATASDDPIRAFASEMKVDADELVFRAFPLVGVQMATHGNRRFGGLRMPMAFVETQSRRFAPAALRLPDGDYHRAIWDLRLLPVCIETGQILLERCVGPLCEGGHLGWVKTFGIDRCEHCMADLSAMDSPVIEPALLTTLRSVADLFTPARRPATLAQFPTELAQDDGQLAVDLLVHLLPVVDSGLWPHVAKPHKAEPVRLCHGLAAAWALMVGWPHDFHRLALERVLGRAHHHQDGNGDHTTRFLNMNDATFTSPALLGTARAIRDPIDVRGANVARIAATTCSIKETASILGVGTATIAQIRRAGALRGVLAYDGGRLQPLFDRAEVSGIATDITRRVGFGTISSELGMPHYCVEQLANMALIDILPHPYFLARYTMHQAAKPSYWKLTNDVVASQTAFTTGHLVPLRQAMKAVGGRFKPWGPAFEAFLAGKISYMVDDAEAPLVHPINICAQDAPLIATLSFTSATPVRLVPAAMMSKSDAADLLNINGPQATELFPDVPTRQGCREKTLVVADVLTIARRSISSSELAVRRGVATQKAYANAVRSGIENHGVAGFCRISAEATFGL